MGGTWTDGWIVLHDGAVAGRGLPRWDGPDDAAPADVGVQVAGRLCGGRAGRATACWTSTREVVVVRPRAGRAAATPARRCGTCWTCGPGIEFSEAYLDPDAEVRLLEQAIGWAPRRTTACRTGMYAFLASLRRKAPHGGPFEYRSCETDVLGWVCEAAAGVPMPELMSDCSGRGSGAESDANIGVDAFGAGMFDGGISATLRDLARFGSMLQRDGASLTGEQVVPAAGSGQLRRRSGLARGLRRSARTTTGCPAGCTATSSGSRSRTDDVLLCLGIHGQMVYVNPAAEVVAAKLSSWPTPQNAAALFATVAAFDAVAAGLRAEALGHGPAGQPEQQHTRSGEGRGPRQGDDEDEAAGAAENAGASADQRALRRWRVRRRVGDEVVEQHPERREADRAAQVGGQHERRRRPRRRRARRGAAPGSAGVRRPASAAGRRSRAIASAVRPSPATSASSAPGDGERRTDPDDAAPTQAPRRPRPRPPAGRPSRGHRPRPEHGQHGDRDDGVHDDGASRARARSPGGWCAPGSRTSSPSVAIRA